MFLANQGEGDVSNLVASTNRVDTTDDVGYVFDRGKGKESSDEALKVTLCLLFSRIPKVTAWQ